MNEDLAELAALAADLRALLDADVRRGLLVEAVGTESAVQEAVPEVEEVVAPEPAPLPPPVRAWSEIAATSRDATAIPAAARSADGEGAEGLANIRADLGDCTRCGLCERRTQIVYGVGDPTADLMVIGEGPGEQEDLRGEPFVGPAGQMLDRMLENVLGLPRPRVYIANVVKCRPPGNRNPEPAEVAACRPFLERQIAAVQPKLLLVLGGVALQNLLGITGIMRSRGKEVAWKGIPAIPTLHPAYLLRQPDDKKLTFEDLKLVRRRYDELGGRR